MNVSARVANPPAKPTLIFDGDCRFCRIWIHRWQQTTGDLVEYFPLQDGSVADRFPELDRPDLASAVHLVDPDGQVTSGAEAVFRSLAVKVHWPLQFYETLPLFARFSEWSYALVARHRGAFSVLTRLLWGNEVRRPEFQWVRWFFLRGVGVVFLIAFISLWTQILGLVGSHGILPVTDQMQAIRDNTQALGWRRIWLLPSFCWISASDSALAWQCVLGTIFSCLLILDVVPALAAFGAWSLYLSLAGAAQLFLGFQWDNLLLEAGLLSVFLAPWKWRPGLAGEKPVSRLMIFLSRWLLFRLMFLSGCVKLVSGDPYWRNLTALSVHYETQPLPTPLAWYAHQLPLGIQEFSCALMFAVEIGVPFLIFLPRRLRFLAFWCFVTLLSMIAATGNYTFFDLLAVVLCLTLLDDQFITRLVPKRWRHSRALARPSLPQVQRIGIVGYAIVSLAVSVLLLTLTLRIRIPWGPPFTSLAAQVAPFRSINSYGLFAVMTTRRPEIIVEGSADGEKWMEFRFKWKPGPLERRPGWVAPHQPRLDWQMWFAALGDLQSNPWLLGFCQRLLEGEPEVLKLLDSNPFPRNPPRFVRLSLYEYHFAPRIPGGEEIWWARDFKAPYPLRPYRFRRGILNNAQHVKVKSVRS